MALTETEIIEALRAVRDPGLELSIVDLDMVKRVEIADGQVLVGIAIPVAGYPPPGRLGEHVRRALLPLAGVEGAQVATRVMSDEERGTLRARLEAVQGPDDPATAGSPLGHEQGRTNPFMRRGSSTRVLGISSGKGGVGKSSVTANLAIALSRLGHRVGVLDADVYGFSIPKMLGVTGDPVPIEDLVVPPVAHAVKVISIGFFVEDDQPIMWRGPMLHKALEQFLVDVFWGELDFLLVDMPPGTGDVALSMAQYLPSSEMFVVTTPQAAAQRVAQRTAYMARKVNLPLRGVIENMSWFTGDDGKRYEIFGRGGGAALSEALGVPLVGQIPLVPQLREGGDVGLPITVSDPDGEASRAFDEVARQVVAMGPGRVYRPELKIS
ncbi:MAG TPA: Mrp/NBP35 family ATP-binding protein [Acidimicrobiales bacterium]|nr:Mrp/NBP35 family ATP-binding protein [Acidimicrobiales bacterium]